VNCRYCGAELPEGALFCGECGRAVVAERAMPAPALVEPPYAALIGPPPVAPAPVAPAASPVAPVAAPVAFSAADAASDDPADHVAPDDDAPSTCPQCGAYVEDDEIFCGECGFVLRTVPPPPPEHLPPPVDDVPVEPEDSGLFADLAAGVPLSDAVPRLPDMSETDLVPALEPDLELSAERVPRPDPFPWGLELAPRPVVPAAAPASPSVPSGIPSGHRSPVEDLEATRLTAGGFAGERFVLQFSTGENVTVGGAGLIGRNPASEPGEVVDQFVAVFDPTKSVSKTHLEFGQESGRFWVSDRFSTNGSIVRQPDADPKRADPGKRYFVARGTRVDIGEQFFVVS
jgi:hypothetical protein